MVSALWQVFDNHAYTMTGIETVYSLWGPGSSARAPLRFFQFYFDRGPHAALSDRRMEDMPLPTKGSLNVFARRIRGMALCPVLYKP